MSNIVKDKSTSFYKYAYKSSHRDGPNIYTILKHLFCAPTVNNDDRGSKARKTFAAIMETFLQYGVHNDILKVLSVILIKC